MAVVDEIIYTIYPASVMMDPEVKIEEQDAAMASTHAFFFGSGDLWPCGNPTTASLGMTVFQQMGNLIAIGRMNGLRRMPHGCFCHGTGRR